MSYIFKRVFFLPLTILGVASLVFLLRPMIPGDPIDYMLGENAMPADQEVLRRAYGLDRSLSEQYLIFLRRLVSMDLGTSIHAGRPVKDMIMERYPATLLLAGSAWLISVLLAIPLGIISALKKDSVIDACSRFGALFGLSMPNFCLGPLLIIFFSIQLGWLPVSGFEGPWHLVLPALTLGLAMSGLLTRMTRSSLLEVLGEDYLTTARAKGVGPGGIILKHALKNALIPVLTLLGLQFGGLLAGSIITETIFAWPGVGSLMITAINSRDFPLLQGLVMAVSLTYVLINLITDLVYALADPRVRLEGKN